MNQRLMGMTLLLLARFRKTALSVSAVRISVINWWAMSRIWGDPSVLLDGDGR